MLIRVFAILCLLANDAVPRCLACCAAADSGRSACCREPDSAPSAAAAPRAESSCCRRAAKSCCETEPTESSRCGSSTEASEPQDSAAQAGDAVADRGAAPAPCPACAVLCVCDGQKAPILPQASQVKSLLDALQGSLLVATLNPPTLAPGLDAPQRDDSLAAFTSESPPERLARLSVWLN